MCARVYVYMYVSVCTCVCACNYCKHLCTGFCVDISFQLNWANTKEQDCWILHPLL